MAWLYIKAIGVYNGRTQQEGICETTDDLDAAAGTNKADYNGSKIDFAPGSFGLCLEEDSRNVKKSDGSWHTFSAAAPATEDTQEEEET